MLGWEGRENRRHFPAQRTSHRLPVSRRCRSKARAALTNSRPCLPGTEPRTRRIIARAWPALASDLRHCRSHQAPCTHPPFRAGAEMAALARQVLGKECPESSMAAVMTTESCREFAARRPRCDGSVRRSLDLLQCHHKPQGLSKQLSRDVVGQGEGCSEAVTLNTGASLLWEQLDALHACVMPAVSTVPGPHLPIGNNQGLATCMPLQLGRIGPQ